MDMYRATAVLSDGSPPREFSCRAGSYQCTLRAASLSDIAFLVMNDRSLRIVMTVVTKPSNRARPHSREIFLGRFDGGERGHSTSSSTQQNLLPA